MPTQEHKTAIVVLVHNQAANISRLFDAYRSLVTQPDLFVFVCDRCTDDSAVQLTLVDLKAPTRIIEVDHGASFQAGRNRDIGTTAAESELGPCDVIYLDGDCVPSPELVTCYREIFDAASRYPVIASGRRVSETDTEQLREDNRFLMPASANTVFAPGMHRLVVSRTPVFSRLATWSCNLGLNSDMIALLRQVNAALDGNPTVFNDGFNGHWGGEDDFVGITAAFLGAAIVAADPNRCSVQHIYHVPRDSSEYVLIMSRKMRRLKHFMTRMRAPGVCFAQTHVSVTANEIVRDALTTEPPPTLALTLSALEPKRRAAHWQILAAHTAVTGPISAHKGTTGPDVSRFRQEMETIATTHVDATAVLPALRYEFTLKSEGPCSSCGSESGFTADGICRTCRSTPRRRMVHRICQGSTTQWVGRTRPIDSHLGLVESDPDNIVSFDTLDAEKSEADALTALRGMLPKHSRLVISVPVTIVATSEPRITTKQDRLLRLGAHDRLRVYGMADILERFRASGLRMRPVFANELGIAGTADDDVVFIGGHDTALADVPRRLYLDIFNGCNYACRSCNIHELKDTGGIDVDMYKKAIREFADLGGVEVHFQSGETWLRKKLVVELARYVRSCRLEPHLITNGSVIQEEDAEALSLFACINISIDSHVPCDHDALRGSHGAFARAVAAMRICDAVTRTQAALVLTEHNFRTLPDYIRGMAEVGFRNVIFNIVEPDFNGGFFNVHPYYDANRIVDVDGLEAVLRKCFVEFSGIMRVDADYIAHTLGSLRGDPYCGASRVSILLGRDGMVRTCAHKPDIGFYKPGNLREIWTGKAALIRREHDKYCGRPCATGNCNRS